VESEFSFESFFVLVQQLGQQKEAALLLSSSSLALFSRFTKLVNDLVLTTSSTDFLQIMLSFFFLEAGLWKTGEKFVLLLLAL
jgi:hypothetical protein